MFRSFQGCKESMYFVFLFKLIANIQKDKVPPLNPVLHPSALQTSRSGFLQPMKNDAVLEEESDLGY